MFNLHFFKETRMKRIKFGLLAICISAVMLLGVSSVSFAADCSKAEILKVGVNAGVGAGTASDNVISIKCLSDSSWGGYTGLIPNVAIGDQALATALTAFSLDKSVWVRASGKTSGSILNVIYMNK